jgi:hypothetical protein
VLILINKQIKQIQSLVGEVFDVLVQLYCRESNNIVYVFTPRSSIALEKALSSLKASIAGLVVLHIIVSAVEDHNLAVLHLLRLRAFWTFISPSQ